MIRKYVSICNKKKIPFLIYASYYWAIKYKAYGLYLPVNLSDMSLNTRVSIFKNNSKDFKIDLIIANTIF